MGLYKREYVGKYKDIISSWGDQDFGDEFEVKIDDWLLQFKEEDKGMMLELLSKFSYYREALFTKQVKCVYGKFLNAYPDWKNDSLIFKMRKEGGRAGHSEIYYQEFWRINVVMEYVCDDLVRYVKDNDRLKNIVLIDDFAGTGNSIISYLKKAVYEVNNVARKKIIILLLHVTESAKLALSNFALDNKLDIEVISARETDKTFKDGVFYFGENCDLKLANYNTICEQLKINNALGYGDTQSLVSMSYNTPNNTLGVFWKEIDQYIPLMNRYKFTGLPQMIRDCDNREKQREESLYIKAIDTYQNLLFMGYCIRKKTKFSVEDTCRKFGLNESQYKIKIAYCIDQGYIKNKDSKFVETDKFWKAVTKYKYHDYFEKFIENNYDDDNIPKFSQKSYMPVDFEKKFNGYK